MAYIKKCEICTESFETSFPHTQVCGKECRRKKVLKIYGRGSANKEIASGTVGAMSEMLIAVDLLSRGYAVFRALSPACFCDLIASKDGALLRVECRTAYRNMMSTSLSFPKKTNGEIDVFALYIPLSKEIVYLQKDAKTEAEI